MEPFGNKNKEVSRVEQGEMTRAMRRGCTRIGLGLLAYMMCLLVVGSVIQIVLEWVFPGSLDNTWVVMVENDLVTYGLGPVVLWLILRPLPTADPVNRGMTPKRMGKLTLEAIGLMYGGELVTTGLIALINTLSGRETGDLLQSATEDMSAGMMFLFMVLIAPICEELIFRRILFRRLLPMGENFAILMSALAFSLFHCNLFQAVYAFAIGVLFGCIIVKTGRLRYTVALHMILNFLGSVVVVLVSPYEMAATAFYLLLYVLMAVGLVIFCMDCKSLFRNRPSLPECGKAAFTSWGMLLFVILFAILSVVIIFYV
jgi:membrane protease YdiL (CAAX protease family)